MTKIARLVAVVSILCAPVAQAVEPALPLSAPSVQTEVAAVVRQMSAMFTDLEGPRPLALFDRTDPAPQYLAEEEADWMIGWEKLEWYFNAPERKAPVQAMDMTPSNIRVRSLTPELALATWDILAEMKFRRGPAMGEKIRANAILRKTAEGWRFIYYAEAAKSTMAYVRDMYENMATDEFRKRFEAPAAAPGP